MHWQTLTANLDSQGIAAILTSLLYFKQKCVSVQLTSLQFPAPKTQSAIPQPTLGPYHVVVFFHFVPNPNLKPKP